MKILGIDTSSQSASCAIVEDRKLLGEFFTNVNLTHSQTIMPMVENLFVQTRLTLSDIDCFAVSDGPGSFTGLRIGLSVVKGMAHALGRPCVGVSTLEALAWNLYNTETVVAPVLDARCKQVYTSLFRWEGEKLTRIEADEAITILQLEERLKKLESCIFLVGDGAQMCYNELNHRVDHLHLTSPALQYLRASSVAMAAFEYAASGQAVPAVDLAPSYLRLPQAERELRAKQLIK